MPTTRGERPCRVGIGPREGGCLYARGRFGVRTQASKRPHVGLFQRNHVGMSTRRRDQADGGLGTPSAGFASVTDLANHAVVVFWWILGGGFTVSPSPPICAPPALDGAIPWCGASGGAEAVALSTTRGKRPRRVGARRQGGGVCVLVPNNAQGKVANLPAAVASGR